MRRVVACLVLGSGIESYLMEMGIFGEYPDQSFVLYLFLHALGLCYVCLGILTGGAELMSEFWKENVVFCEAECATQTWSAKERENENPKLISFCCPVYHLFLYHRDLWVHSDQMPVRGTIPDLQNHVYVVVILSYRAESFCVLLG
jgi:hypothetical protein